MDHLQNIFDDCGFSVQYIEKVQGGDINETYCLNTSSGKYFLKVNEKDAYPLMFEKESKGLELLRKSCLLKIPQVIRTGVADNTQYLILEWLEKGPPHENMWEEFGEALAQMHRQPGEYFGLDHDNYIGSLVQVNKEHHDWATFFVECRILPLVKVLVDNGRYSKQDLSAINTFCKQVKNMFPEEPPALLHGDLWCGNYIIHSSGFAAMYDPAVYFGHREVEIGMTRLFGGFDQRFYNAYISTYPLQKEWEKRLPVTQLYPLLVHAVLFGGHYITASKKVFLGSQ